MKPIDGYQLSKKIREYFIIKKINQPLIALCTGDNSQMNKTVCDKYGINTILKKPVDVQQLTRVLKMMGYLKE